MTIEEIKKRPRRAEAACPMDRGGGEALKHGKIIAKVRERQEKALEALEHEAWWESHRRWLEAELQKISAPLPAAEKSAAPHAALWDSWSWTASMPRNAIDISPLLVGQKRWWQFWRKG